MKRAVGQILLVILAGSKFEAHGQVPQFRAAVELKIDGVENDLSPIATITVSPRGTIAVWQGQDYNIRFFDSLGTALGTFGRSGEGPGEFRFVGLRRGWVADTLWLIDPSTRRVTFVGPDRRLVRSVPWPQHLRLGQNDSIPLAGSAGLVPYAQYPDGTMLSSLSWPVSVARPAWYPETELRVPYVRVTSSGAFRQVVAWGPSPKVTSCRLSVRVAGSEWSVGVPYCPMAPTEASSDGERVVSAVPSSGATFLVVALDAEGDTVFSREHSYRPRRIPQRMLDSVRTRLLQLPNFPQMASGELRSQALAAVKAITLPKVFPPFQRLVVGGDGSIWLEQWLETTGHSWLILGADGNLLGQLELPANSRLTAATRSTVWAVESDEDDVQSVVRYRLVRSAK